jgi:hypothetical protein
MTKSEQKRRRRDYIKSLRVGEFIDDRRAYSRELGLVSSNPFPKWSCDNKYCPNAHKRPDAYRCELCKTNAYCSRECQIADRPVHRSNCTRKDSEIVKWMVLMREYLASARNNHRKLYEMWYEAMDEYKKHDRGMIMICINHEIQVEVKTRDTEKRKINNKNKKKNNNNNNNNMRPRVEHAYNWHYIPLTDTVTFNRPEYQEAKQLTIEYKPDRELVLFLYCLENPDDADPNQKHCVLLKTVSVAVKTIDSDDNENDSNNIANLSDGSDDNKSSK